MSTDFLYLQPQQDQPAFLSHDPHFALNKTNKFNRSTALGSTSATNTSHRDDTAGDLINNNPNDKEPLPRRLRDVMKERVILIERGSAICDNMGLGYVDYANLKRGKYRLYFMRIENEQRIMFNSRLDVLGASNSFSINNVVEEGMDRKSMSPVRDNRNGGIIIRINGHNGSVVSN